MSVACPCCGLTQTDLTPDPTPHQQCAACKHRWRAPGLATQPENYYARLSGRNNMPAGNTERKLSDRLTTLVPLLSDGMRILEIGCAEGALGALIKKQFKLSYTGVELSNDAAIAETVLDRVVKAPSETITNESFDLIVSFHVLEHIPDIHREVLHWHSLLHESGTIVVEVPHEAGHPFLNWDANPEHLHQFSACSLLSLFDNGGFQVSSMTTRHYESPVYSDSLRLTACHRLDRSERHNLLLHRFLGRMQGEFAVYGIGGDFQNYLLPYMHQLRVVALIDSDPQKHGSSIHGIEVASLESVQDKALPILIASIRYKDEIYATLTSAGIDPDRIVCLDDIYNP